MSSIMIEANIGDIERLSAMAPKVPGIGSWAMQISNATVQMQVSTATLTSGQMIAQQVSAIELSGTIAVLSVLQCTIDRCSMQDTQVVDVVNINGETWIGGQVSAVRMSSGTTNVANQISVVELTAGRIIVGGTELFYNVIMDQVSTTRIFANSVTAVSAIISVGTLSNTYVGVHTSIATLYSDQLSVSDILSMTNLYVNGTQVYGVDASYLTSITTSALHIDFISSTNVQVSSVYVTSLSCVTLSVGTLSGVQGQTNVLYADQIQIGGTYVSTANLFADGFVTGSLAVNQLVLSTTSNVSMMRIGSLITVSLTGVTVSATGQVDQMYYSGGYLSIGSVNVLGGVWNGVPMKTIYIEPTVSIVTTRSITVIDMQVSSGIVSALYMSSGVMSSGIVVNVSVTGSAVIGQLRSNYVSVTGVVSSASCNVGGMIYLNGVALVSAGAASATDIWRYNTTGSIALCYVASVTSVTALNGCMMVGSSNISQYLSTGLTVCGNMLIDGREVYPPGSVGMLILSAGTYASGTTAFAASVAYSYGSGVYSVTASSVNGTAFPFYAMTRSYTSTNYWESALNVYNVTTGLYSGSAQLGTGTVLGEYLKVNLPQAIVCNEYTVSGYVTYSTAYLARMYLYGSNDNTTWTQLSDSGVASLTWLPNVSSLTSQLIRFTNAVAYSTYGLVIRNNCRASSIRIYNFGLSYTEKANGRVTADLLIQQQNAVAVNNTAYCDGRGLMIESALTNHYWNLFNDSDNLNLQFSYRSVIMGYLDNTNVGTIDFTGQHRPISANMDLYSGTYVGYIVRSMGEYNNISDNVSTTQIMINEAIPCVDLTSVAYDKRCFGVISDSEDTNQPYHVYQLGMFNSVFPKREGNSRLIINSLGEGGIWVSNYNGNVQNGDWITTSPIPGIGMRQETVEQYNYTVAKATCDCNFVDGEYQCQIISYNGTDYRMCFIGCTYHCG